MLSPLPHPLRDQRPHTGNRHSGFAGQEALVFTCTNGLTHFVRAATLTITMDYPILAISRWSVDAPACGFPTLLPGKATIPTKMTYIGCLHQMVMRDLGEEDVVQHMGLDIVVEMVKDGAIGPVHRGQRSQVICPCPITVVDGL